MVIPAISLLFALGPDKDDSKEWIRINQLGYAPAGIKVAVWCSKNANLINSFQLVDASTGKVVFSNLTGKPYGAYGPFEQSYRLDFSRFNTPGNYYLMAGTARSSQFRINAEVYKGTADFCLRYMRQQRSGFNPFLKDSCHTDDGYSLYGEKAGIRDSTFIDVTGGWHDASDYLQYVTTSANATFHLLMADRDFPSVFTDQYLANGLDGSNGIRDVLDEAKWGLDWLLKMHPRPDWMFNQLADDRDHMGMRIPKMDSFYGRGFQRPVYFLTGEPQQRGKFMNNTTGTSSTGGKFSSAFSLGAERFKELEPAFSSLLYRRSVSAYKFATRKLGYTQTASVRSPYIYAESNWLDDLELAAASLSPDHEPDADWIVRAMHFARQEPITPWLGKDTAHHYQWYPFINVGHYELARQLEGKRKDTVLGFYRQGIELIWQKASGNAFFRGIPFIWCSNNLTTSFAIQCYWYRTLSGDARFAELEQANFDWLFGCNPWGTSMVYGLPSWGDTPVDPHSAFTHLENYPIDGGLVDGPVYGNIYKNLIGIQLKDADEYAEFQSNLAVYHDDYGDYSTNEPTMDGTASLIYLLAAKEAESAPGKKHYSGSGRNSLDKGAIVRGDSTQKTIALVFTGDEFAEGGIHIANALDSLDVPASFFFTGRFYRNESFGHIISKLHDGGHYLGAHSDQHLLYCDWNNRDSLLVSWHEFAHDLHRNYKAMGAFGINPGSASFFLPPYEWYNDTIARWTAKLGLRLINYTPGTLSHADYTTPLMKNYRNSETIHRSILDYENQHPSGLNGFMLLFHMGTGPGRTDKFYSRLPVLITELKAKGYTFQTVEQLLGDD